MFFDYIKLLYLMISPELKYESPIKINFYINQINNSEKQNNENNNENNQS